MFKNLCHLTPEVDHQILEKLAARAARLGGTGRAIEIGSWVGGTALTIAPFFNTLYCIDTFEGSPCDQTGWYAQKLPKGNVFESFCHNMQEEGDDLFLKKIIPLVGTSEQWSSVWNLPVDFIFIDADHRYANVVADIKAWQPHALGILCGHDYCAPYPDVIKAVNESFDVFEDAGNVWWVET